MEQWNESDEKGTLRSICKKEELREANKKKQEKECDKALREEIQKIESYASLVNWDYNNIEIPSEYGYWKSGEETSKMQETLKWSLEAWYKYLYLKELDINGELADFDIIDFDTNDYEKKVKQLRCKLKGRNYYALSQYKREVQRKIASILRGIVTDKKLKDEAVFGVLFKDGTSNLLSYKDIKFLEWLLELANCTAKENPAAVKLKKGKYDDIYAFKNSELSILYSNIRRILDRKNSDLTEEKFEELWEKNFPDLDKKIFRIEIKQKFLEIKNVIADEILMGDVSFETLTDVMSALDECLKKIESVLVPSTIKEIIEEVDRKTNGIPNGLPGLLYYLRPKISSREKCKLKNNNLIISEKYEDVLGMRWFYEVREIIDLETDTKSSSERSDKEK